MIARSNLRSVAVYLLLSGTLILGGCSYFNAFYNTKRAFTEAEAERERSTDINARPGEYNDAVEAGSRLIEMYPDSKFIDDALFIMGQSYYWLQDYHKSRRKFEELLSNYPDSPHVMGATMWLGKVNVQLKKRQEATSLLRGLIADTDDADLIGESRFALAELYYVDSLFVKAAEEFAKIPDISVDKDLIGESYWRAGESLYREKWYPEAAEMLKLGLDSKQTPSLRFQTRLLYGQALRESDNPEEALGIFNSLLKDKRYFREHGKVRVQKGLALADVGQREEAFEEWEKTILDHSRTDEAAQAYYEKGLVYLETEGERTEAKEAFDKSRVEKARSKYSMKADSMLTMLNRVDDLNLSRVKIRKRVDYTELWLTDPISPADTTAFLALEYYDSLAFDSLALPQLWGTAWRDSVIIIEPDSAEVAAAMALARLDSLALVSAADSARAIIVADSLAQLDPAAADTVNAVVLPDSLVHEDSTAVVEMRPLLDPFSEYATQEPDQDVSLDSSASIDSLAMFGFARGPAGFDTVGVQMDRPDPSGESDPRRMRARGMPDPGMRPPDIPEEEWNRMLEERFGAGDRMGGPGMGGPGNEDSRIMQRRGQEKPVETSGLVPEPDPAPPGREIETLTIFDIQPVVDSLAQLRVDLLEARFQLGEIQLFDLMQPDSARKIFIELAEPQNVDSVRARAGTVLAYIHRLQGDTTAADSFLMTIADEFSTTRAGRLVIQHLNLEEEDLATPAEIAYREAEALLIGEDQEQEAYDQYLWVRETYPRSDWAPRAMYAAAYVAGHHLHDGESAEELLNLLIENYEESSQAQRAREKISAYDAIRFSSDIDTVDIETQFAEFDAFGEEEVDQIAEIIGGIEALSSTLESRNLLPQEVIQGTGGEVLLRFIVNAENQAGNFRIVSEDPPGRGLGRALIAGLEEIPFRSARMEGSPVSTRVERRYTLPLDAPPNVRPLPKR
jgi:tetratricopeptide (TPR) repeat protein